MPHFPRNKKYITACARAQQVFAETEALPSVDAYMRHVVLKLRHYHQLMHTLDNFMPVFSYTCWIDINLHWELRKIAILVTNTVKTTSCGHS